MAYQALYRTWRPMVFDDVTGQEHITKTLRNEIMTDSLAHAYLFCGTRGTGKTTMAKILARAVNCQHPVNGNPCNECEICKGILDDSILDVVEMDGASRNKVENIRELIDDVAFLPTRARKKVYIIDEVHMVTTQAFNALLKTLEEPPAHVMFILATTELNKIPPTVLSRCQRFDFKRITTDKITQRLSEIVTASGRVVAPEALRMIAELGDGSMRDALSVLEQVLGYTQEAISYEDLLSIIGITDFDSLFSLAGALAENDGGKALSLLDQAIENGKEPETFMDRLAHFLRDLLVVKLSKQPESMLNVSASHLNRMKKTADAFTREKLIYALKLLNEATADAKSSGYGRTVYELALVKLAEPSYDVSTEALLSRVAELEKKLAQGVPLQVISPQSVPEPTPPEEELPWEMAEPDEDEPETVLPEAEIPPMADGENDTAPVKQEEKTDPNQNSVLGQWEEIKSFLRSHGGAPILPHVNRAKPMLLRDKVALIFGQDALMNKTVAARPANLELIQSAIREVTGEAREVICLSEKEAGISEEKDSFDKLLELSKSHSEIEII